MILILMGVSGVGKTTIGQLLSRRAGWRFEDADDYHSDENRRRMAAGIPLTDADRLPWLGAVHARISQYLQEGKSAVFACSALKQQYRATLTGGFAESEIRFVYLYAPAALIRERTQLRNHPYMNPNLLDSQMATLEEPSGAWQVSRHRKSRAVRKRHPRPATGSRFDRSRIVVHDPHETPHLRCPDFCFASLPAQCDCRKWRPPRLPVVVDFRSLGSTTAWFFKPYFDTPNTTGVASDDLSKPMEMYANISGADRVGLQVAIHAIGDRANNTILNFYERVEKENGSRDGRFRIEHAQHPVEIEKTRVEMTVFDGKVIYQRKWAAAH